MAENEYGANILTGWDNPISLINQSVEQIKQITDSNRSTAYKLSYECTALRSVKSCFILYWGYREGTSDKKCTRLLPIMSTGAQQVRFEVPEGTENVKIICRGDLDIKNISLQHDTGLTQQIKDAIADVTQLQVINVETAHILNAWIKNLFVEYLETNMDARLDRTTVERHFIRIVNEREEMVFQQLNTGAVEDLLIPDPRDSSSTINVYFTAIGNHPDAYRYFTITHPQSIHKDLSAADVEAFKVKVKMVINEVVLYSKEFKTITLENGEEVITPVETWGQGTGGGRGKYESWKDQVGQYFIQYNQNNNGFTGFRLNGVKERMEWWDGKTLSWKPFIQAYGEGLNVAQIGNVVIHPRGSTVDTIQPTGLPCLHVAHNGTVLKEWTYSKLMQHSSILGQEVVTTLAPILRLITVNINVTAFDGGSCEGLTVSITGDKSYTGTTNGQGKCTMQIDDGNYNVKVTGYNGNKYTTSTQRITYGGVTPLNLNFVLTDSSGMLYIYSYGTQHYQLYEEIVGGNNTKATCTFNSDHIHYHARARSSAGSESLYVTTLGSNIDLTPYTKLKVELNVIVEGTVDPVRHGFGYGVGRLSNHAYKPMFGTNGTEIVEYDISSLRYFNEITTFIGSGYNQVGKNVNAYVYRIWLE